MRTSYMGHLKERTLKDQMAKDQMAKDPTEVIRKAVLRMLPRNKLRAEKDQKLRIFVGGEHPFGDRPIETYKMPPREVREMRPRARRPSFVPRRRLSSNSKVGTMQRRAKRDSKQQKLLHESMLSQTLQDRIFAYDDESKFLPSYSFQPLLVIRSAIFKLLVVEI